MTAGAMVANRLRDAKVRPVDLASAIGVSPPAASMMIKGKRGIAVWHLDKIAALLGMSVPELFRDLPGHGAGVQQALGKGGGAPDDKARNRVSKSATDEDA